MESSVRCPSTPNTYSYVREENSVSTRKFVENYLFTCITNQILAEQLRKLGRFNSTTQTSLTIWNSCSIPAEHGWAGGIFLKDKPIGPSKVVCYIICNTIICNIVQYLYLTICHYVRCRLKEIADASMQAAESHC